MLYARASFTSSACRRRPMRGPCQRPVTKDFLGRKGFGGRLEDSNLREGWVVGDRAGVSAGIEASGVSSDAGNVASAITAGTVEGSIGIVAIDGTYIGCLRLPGVLSGEDAN